MYHVCCIIPSLGDVKILPHLKKCLTSLERSSHNQVDLSIFLVTSNPKLRDKVLSYRIHNFYLVDSSLGFSEMNNIAIEESLRFYESDYYLFINDDAWIEKSFFKEFLKQVKIAQPDLVVSLIYKKGDSIKIDSYGVEYYKSGYAQNATESRTSTTLASAACLLVKTAFLKKMNKTYGYFFNPLLFSYFEDVEFSIRSIGIEAQIVKNSSLKVHHIGSLSYQTKSYLIMYQMFRNILWVILLTWPKKLIVKYMVGIVTIQIWFVFCTIRDGRPFLYLKIIIETLIQYPKLIRYRRKNLGSYSTRFKFDTVFSPYLFRSRRNRIAF